MTENKFDIATFGSITLDMFVELDDMKVFSDDQHDYFGFEIGQKIRMKTIDKSVGGGAANTAVAFAKMGLKTICKGTIGDDDNGKFIMHNLQGKNICTDYIHVEETHPSSVSIIIMNKLGDRTVFNEKTSPNSFSKIPNTKAIYSGHLSETEAEIFPKIVDWKNKDSSKVFAWNPGKTQFEKGFNSFRDLFKVTDVLVLNAEEAELFTNLGLKKIKTSDYSLPCIAFSDNATEEIYDLKEIGGKFINAGVKNVLITDGKRGAQFFSLNESFYMPMADIKPAVHTLGAGDAFSVGAVTLFLEGKSPKEMMIGGSLNASAVVRYFGAQVGILSHQELSTALNNY